MVADKPMQGHWGMSNWLNFETRISAFALPPAIAVMHGKHGIACDMMHQPEATGFFKLRKKKEETPGII